MSEEPKEWKFEDIKIGYEIKPIVCDFSEEDVNAFVKLSGDANPLHVDDEFAKSKGFAARLVHGALLASKFSYLVGMIIPGKSGLYLSQESNFHKPILINEQFKVKGTVVRKSEATRIIEIKTEIFNSKGEVAVEGRVLVKMI